MVEFAKDKIQVLEYDLLKNRPVAHAVFTRHGGVSAGAYASLNLGDASGDHPDSVKANREQIRKMLGLDHIVFAHSGDEGQIARITSQDRLKSPNADILITKEKGIGLAITHADCQGAIFYDPVHHAIAVVHAGWRGNVKNVYAQAVDALHREAQSLPRDLLVCISPSLGPCHSEFKNYKTELPQDFWRFEVKPTYFDLWAIARSQLAACKIPEKNIEIAEICTYCTGDDYFSYRREKKSGRNATVAALL